MEDNKKKIKKNLGFVNEIAGKIDKLASLMFAKAHNKKHEEMTDILRDIKHLAFEIEQKSSKDASEKTIGEMSILAKYVGSFVNIARNNANKKSFDEKEYKLYEGSLIKILSLSKNLTKYLKVLKLLV